MLIKRLRELREINNYTQEDIAEHIGVARTTYAMHEQGNREMDYHLIIKLADLYKVTLDYIFGRSDMPIHLESYTDDEIEFMVRSLSLYKELKGKLN